MSNTSEEIEEEIEVVIEDEASEEEVQSAEPVEDQPEVIVEEESENTGSDEELTDYSKNVQNRIKKLTDKYRKEERDKQEALRLTSQLMEEKRR